MRTTDRHPGTSITVAPAAQLPAAPSDSLLDAAARASEYASHARSANTLRAYGVAWRGFSAWCAEHDLDSLPALPATVAAYIASRADGSKVASLQLALTAISQAHEGRELPNPAKTAVVRAVMQGIKRQHRSTQRQVQPITVADLRKIIEAMQPEDDNAMTLSALRDRALLLLGFSAALRRSEIVALDVSDIEPDPNGLRLTIRQSKTDQTGQGRTIAVPFGGSVASCPVRSLQSWLAAAGIAEGPLFVAVKKGDRLTRNRMAGNDVARLIKRWAKRARLNGSRQFSDFSGHSLRAGLCTEAARQGRSLPSIQQQSRHKSVATLLKYVRNGSLFDDCAAAGLGL